MLLSCHTLLMTVTVPLGICRQARLATTASLDVMLGCRKPKFHLTTEHFVMLGHLWNSLTVTIPIHRCPA